MRIPNSLIRAATAAVLVGAAYVANASPTTTPSQPGASSTPVQVGPNGPLPGSLREIPAPPISTGCYHYHLARWEREDCATAQYIREHIPHPELIAGVEEKAVTNHTPAPFKGGSVLVDLQNAQETDSEAGAENFSVQVNAFFEGTNHASDGVQFTSQVQQDGSSYTNNICVWNVDIPAQAYSPYCLTVNSPNADTWVGGLALGQGLLATAMRVEDGSPLGEIWLVIAPDSYGLSTGDRWNNVSGTILGYGNGSEAFFTKPDVQVNTFVYASTCLSQNPAFTIPGHTCTSAEKLGHDAVAFESPKPGQPYTVETNNLEPVTGNPSTHLPPVDFPNDWSVGTDYAATRTGKCASGKAPLCL